MTSPTSSAVTDATSDVTTHPVGDPLPVAHLMRGGPVNLAERPLLARVAEDVFWCARYVERSEHLARCALVTSQLALDAGDAAAPGGGTLRDRLWANLCEAFDVPPPKPDGEEVGERTLRYLLADAANPLGAPAAVAHARENARGVRGEISAEMWQTLNELYWSLHDGGQCAAARHMLADGGADGLCQHLIRGSMLFQGAVDGTLAHGRRFDFAVLGRSLERAEATCRILAARARFLDEFGQRLEPPLRNIQLTAALRMCGSIEAYRRQHLAELDLLRVAGFLLLRAEHPRSVRFAVSTARDAVRRISLASDTPVGGVDAAERVLGRLAARLEYAETADVAEAGVANFLVDVRRAAAEANAALRDRFFAG